MVSIITGIELSFYLKNLSGLVAEYGIPAGLFFMIYPAMTKVHLSDIGKSLRNAKTVGLMVFLNYAIAPFLVAALGYFFFEIVYSHYNLLSANITSQVLVGIILLGVAP